MKMSCLGLIALFLVLGCAQTSQNDNPEPKPLTDADREQRVDTVLQPVVLSMKEIAGKRNLGLGRFVKDGADYEPRVSRYIIARLEKQLVEEGVTVIERRDLDKVLEELEFQLSDLVDQDTSAKIGRIAGIDVMAIGTVKEVSLTVYRIDIKLEEMETGKILMTAAVDVDRKNLPVKYGGK